MENKPSGIPSNDVPIATAGTVENLKTERKHLLVLIGITLLCLLPFLGKAFHVDDTLFVWCGKQIQQCPFDPYGFNVNWFGPQAPMSEVMRNPPLTPYYIALAGSLSGWNETGVHIALLLPALACIVGIYSLAKYWCNNPLLAALISLFTPAFLVSSTTVMCDVMMLAFEVWALVFWVRAHDKKKLSLFIGSVLFLTGCVLTKFTGVTVIPLLFIYSLVREKKIILQNLYLLVPIAALTLYLVWFKAMYGGESIWDSLSFATSAGAGRTIEWSTVIVSLSFLGGCFFPVIFFAPVLWRWKFVIAGVILVAAILIQVIAGDLFSNLVLQKVSIASPVLGIQLVLFSICGILLLILAITEILRNRDAVSITLGLLVLGTVVLTTFISWSISARYLLPLTPAVGILIIRGIDQRIPKKWLYLLLLPSVVFALMVTSADFSVANSARVAAEELAAKYKTEHTELWFQGHWGFQYYMELHNAKPLDGQYPDIKPGETLIYPENNSTFPIDRSIVRLREKVEYPVVGFVATMSPSVGAGFYAHVRGPFPFAFGNVENETYYVLRFISP